MTTTRGRGRPRGAERAELLDVARELLLARGLAATTMDAIAAGARVSKTSVYRDLGSKEEMYRAVVLDWVDRGRDAMRPVLDRLVEAPDITAGLLEFAQVLQAAVLSEPVRRMRTLVAAEAERFPDVAQAYVTQSWDRNVGALAEALLALDRRGALTLDDAQVAAHQLTWLVVAAPLNEQTLTGGAACASAADLERTARAGVTTFLARYGRR